MQNKGPKKGKIEVANALPQEKLSSTKRGARASRAPNPVFAELFLWQCVDLYFSFFWGPYFLIYLRNFTKNHDPLPIDLFRLISMRGARIWPQNGGKRPGTLFFLIFRKKKTPKLANTTRKLGNDCDQETSLSSLSSCCSARSAASQARSCTLPIFESSYFGPLFFL